MINKNPSLILSTCLLLALPLTGCLQDDLEDADAIESSLQQINGGLDMEDEAPMFGEPDLFKSADLPQEVAVADAMDEDETVVALEAHPEVKRTHVGIRWGQIPFNAEAEAVIDWSGRLSVNRGALLVRRVMAFEADFGDTLKQREDRLNLSFVSTTKPGSDGLRLVLLDPTPQAPEPLTLTYTATSGAVHAFDIGDIVGAPQSVEIGTNGDRIIAVAMPQPDANCEHGVMNGRWHRVAPQAGRLLGQLRAADGDLLGHMRGVYGQRANGNRVFFGKYIDSEGSFQGLFAGRYQEGHFRGRWMAGTGEVGALGGQYRESIEGEETGGHFLGRWAETSCRVEVGPGSEFPDTP